MSMNYKPGKGGARVKPVVVCGPGKTKQSFGERSDINHIVARYQRTGMLENVRENPGVFADVSLIEDYPGMVKKLRFARESFEQLPPNLRNRFHNDPGELVAFISDDGNRPEAIKLGIIPKPVKPKAKDVVVPDAGSVPVVSKKTSKKDSDGK